MNFEKNKNTLQAHKGNLNKKLKEFFLKEYIWPNSEDWIIIHDKATDSYKTLFIIEPSKEYRQEDIRPESKGFDEDFLSSIE